MDITTVKNDKAITVMEIYKRKDVIIAHKYLDEEGRLHKDTKKGPAFVMFYQDGNILCERYYLHGLRHRKINEGPAYIIYNANGSVYKTEYWEEDKIKLK